MQQKKITLLTLFITVSLLIACNSNENKKTETPEVKSDTITEAKATENTTNDKQPEAAPQKTTAAALDGAWEIVRAEGSSVKSNLGTVYTFDGDRLTMGKNGFNNPGKTEITGSTFSFENDATKGYKMMYDYTFNGDTLVVVVQNSNGQTFYMVKK